jgi:transglutaminase-like putative cysteine protease
MDIRLGYEISYNCFQPTPMMLMLTIHHSRAGDLHAPDTMTTNPAVPITGYRDAFGNWCSRFIAPPGPITITAGTTVRDSGLPDRIAPHAGQLPVEELPDDVLVFLLGSRYCETDRLSDIAWSLFGGYQPGWARVQAIIEYVHGHIAFGYPNARATRTAWEAFNEHIGVCRDFAHLAVTLCRCMNIPARYCTGYLGDIGVPVSPDPMDFSAWFEVYLGGEWYTMDARHAAPRIGRVLIARGRDATDVAISNVFGPNALTQFKVWTDEVPATSQAGNS